MNIRTDCSSRHISCVTYNCQGKGQCLSSFMDYLCKYDDSCSQQGAPRQVAIEIIEIIRHTLYHNRQDIYIYTHFVQIIFQIVRRPDPKSVITTEVAWLTLNCCAKPAGLYKWRKSVPSEKYDISLDLEHHEGFHERHFLDPNMNFMSCTSGTGMTRLWDSSIAE